MALYADANSGRWLRRHRSLAERLRRIPGSLRRRLNRGLLLYRRRLRGAREFSFRGRPHRYFFHRRNWTWTNERCVELAIVRRMLEEAPGARVLEVGRVLPGYFPTRHPVIDKYDPHGDVLRVDVVDFRSPERYDLIISISTLEHVGWDEEPRDPTKVIRALANLREHLSEDGVLLVTIPLGYNPELERLFEQGELDLGEVTCLRRVSKDNEWAEAPWAEVKGSPYLVSARSATAIMVATLQRGSCRVPPNR